MNPTQILFDRAVAGIINQDALARDDYDETCHLRLEHLACAVGQCVDDKHYEPRLEDLPNPVDPDADKIRRAIAASNPDLNLDTDSGDPVHPYWSILAELQSAHDDAPTVNRFLKSAKGVAHEFGLEWRFD